jgi:aryl-alcohol dehydrogenase-like predicted oxidoreductase
MDFKAHTTLGRTGLSVSRLGIGAAYGAPAWILEKAFHEHGVNAFYWGALRKAEMGNALRNLCWTDRDRVVVMFQTYDKSGFLMRHFHEKGLRTLGIDCADILIMGWSSREPGGRWLDSALRLKEEGKVRFLCVSGHNRGVLGEMAARPDLPFDVYMVRYNAAHTGAEQDIFPCLQKENPPGIMTFTATRWGQLMQRRRVPPGEEPLTAADCYRFVLSNPAVDLCMTGPRTAEELEGGLEALELGPLSDEEMVRIRLIGNYLYQK